METDDVTGLHAVRILAQEITDRGYKPDEVHHGQEILDDLIVVEGRNCSDAETRCMFFSSPSPVCPRDTASRLLCAPRKMGEPGFWFVRPQEYATWKLTK